MPDDVTASSRSAVTPLEVDGVRTAVVGTILWAVALVAMFLVHDRLTASDDGWWIGTGFVGVLLGLIGIGFLLRRRAAYRRAVSGSDQLS